MGSTVGLAMHTQIPNEFYSCFLAVVVVAKIMNFMAKIYLILALHILHTKIHFGFLFEFTLIFFNSISI